MFEESEFPLNKQKLKDVVHYICNECAQSDLGNVKLHKILYFTDMLHYLQTGEALTGVEYQKQQFGPVARHLSWAVNELSKDGVLQIEKRDYFGYLKTDYKVVKAPDPSALTNLQHSLLKDIIGFVCTRSAKEISEFSHKSPWEAAEMGGIIPYFSAYGLVPDIVSDADMESCIEEAKRIRPIIERELNGSHFF